VCLIVDANLASTVFASPPHPDFTPVLDWLDKQDGRIVFGGRLAIELERLEKARRYLRTLLQAGRAWRLSDEFIDEEEVVVADSGLCRSNDSHVIALARVSGARTLCTHDGDLQTDFKNPQLVSNPRGSIYKYNRPSHIKLLRHTSSCGRLPRGRRR
jgi:predicted nucleic acid-binding protein